jgi:hypothetical protein
MVADYFSKPLQGKLFQQFKKAIMGHWMTMTMTFVSFLWDDRSVLDLYITYGGIEPQNFIWSTTYGDRQSQTYPRHDLPILSHSLW